MHKYIDCDGVILDTENGLFDFYDELKKNNPSLKKIEYLQKMDWYNWIYQAEILNDAINILKNYDPKDCSILTKVHSLKEGVIKVEYFREQKVENNIIIVPNTLMKSEIVKAKNSILVDDSINNLNDWNEAGGIPIYYGQGTSDYPTVSSLDEVLSENILEDQKVKKYTL